MNGRKVVFENLCYEWNAYVLGITGSSVDHMLWYQSSDYTDTRPRQREGTVWRNGTKACIACLYPSNAADKMLEIFFSYEKFWCFLFFEPSDLIVFITGGSRIDTHCRNKFNGSNKWKKTGIFISIVIAMVVAIRGVE